MADDEGTQYATRAPRSTDFPPEWGHPPGRPYSEERAAWVLAHVRRHVGDPVRHLLKVQRIHLNDLRRELVKRRMREGEELAALLREAEFVKVIEASGS